MSIKHTLYSLTICILTLASCSTVNKVAVSSSSGVIYSAAQQSMSEPNYEIFKNGLSGNLLLIEGLLSQAPNDKDLLATLNKGYAGYAFAVNETQILEDALNENKEESGKRNALLNYTRSIEFGKRYLAQYKINFSDLVELMNEPHGIIKLLDFKLDGKSKRDKELVLFTAQSLAGIINLEKDNIGLVSQLPIAKEMFDWVCLKDSSINYGMCEIFYGAYEAGRPTMLGGNPTLGKEYFLKAILKHPHNWLIRTSYIQYYLIPQLDEEGFREQMSAFEEFQELFDAKYIYDFRTPTQMEWAREEGLRFFQSLALKRYDVLNKLKNKIF